MCVCAASQRESAHATHCTHNIKELHKYLSFNFSISSIKAAKITQRASGAAPDLRAHPAPLGSAKMAFVIRPAFRFVEKTAFSSNNPSCRSSIWAREAVSGNSSRCCTGLARFAEPSRLKRKELNGLVLRRRHRACNGGETTTHCISKKILRKSRRADFTLTTGWIWST